ncbi:glycosyltransferase family 39 protein [Mariniblastus fucicola]|uniref:Glycosyltransferase RgtA/B/C/D-like domain-containing protein n=1 Tax=Mariniblastus fucicola TaxID=980251 RepID=A0A5B9PCW3_9BACT|nr:hypothetical protein [Mariniblastus fucicola]QEG24134.1 hypothetical protein MFFC18_40500 [Mariniblastus fucicola]
MKESAIAWFALAIIIGVGIYLRADAVFEPMWLDECHTAWTVDADSLSVVAGRAADGNQPPLYFGLVWATTQLLGMSEFALRLVSLLAGSSLLIVAPWWARTLTNRWSAAFLVAGLIAFDGQFIFYASEARSYALVQLIGLLQGMAFWKILFDVEAPNTQSAAKQSLIWKMLVWTSFSIALLFCHYTSAWILIAEAVFVVLVAWKRRQFPLEFLVAGIVISVAMAPNFWNMSTVFRRRANWDSVSSTAQLWQDVEPWLVHWMLVPIGFAFAAWLFGFIQPSTRFDSASNSTDQPLEPNGKQFGWLWIFIWAIIGPLGIAAAHWLNIAPMALVRYSIVCWVAIALFATFPLKQCSRRLSWIVAVVILGSSFFGNWWVQEVVQFRQPPRFRSEDWVSTVSQLAESDSTQPIFQFADVIEDIDAVAITDPRFQTYLQFPILGADAVRAPDRNRLAESHHIAALPTWNPQFTNDHLDWIREAKGCWFIVRGNLDYAVIIPGELEGYLKQSIEFKFIPNDRMPDSQVHLIRVRLVDDVEAAQ